MQGKSCLIVRGQGGREVLSQQLQGRGANVEYMEVYRREIPVDNEIDITSMLEQGQLDAITLTSGDALKHLLAMVGDELHAQLILVPLIVLSTRIKALAEKYKFNKIAVTESPSDTAIIKTVVMSLKAQ